MKAAILSTHATRPDYTRQVLAAISGQCQGMIHIAGVEKTPSLPGITAAIEEASGGFADSWIIPNESPAHTNNNFLNCLQSFLETDCDAFIYMEDDLLFSKGAVRFLLDAIDVHGKDEMFSHATPASSEDGHHPTEANLSVSTPTAGFASLWGVSGTRTTAERLVRSTPRLDAGMKERAKGDHSLVWDVAYDQMKRSEGWFAVVPLVSRMQNIGDVGGLHRGGHRWETWEGQ